VLVDLAAQDPKAEKPEDWDEREEIPDPKEKKPDGWDDIPATISDKDAKKPEDWDDEEDGTWEAPVIPNPEVGAADVRGAARHVDSCQPTCCACACLGHVMAGMTLLRRWRRIARRRGRRQHGACMAA
jgi:hypothetical protein